MPAWLLNLLCVAGGGASGSLLRWWTALGVKSLLGNAWPWGTLTVNILGCFLFGFGFQWSLARGVPDDHPLRLLFFTGFLGAYTTYSTFAFDSHELQLSRGWHWAMVNVLAQVLLGWLAVWGGIAAAGAYKN
ncbi:MAG: fluoride efflux transporter CrcB [Pirellulales bacterium]|nr:fluoride efflux transporter CrcB [Pirellulales bacterium]